MDRVLRTLRVVVGDVLSGAWYLVVNLLAGSPLMPRHFRFLVYRLCGLRVHSWNIWPSCRFKNNKIRIGRATLINEACRFDSHASIEIGDHCALAMEVLICTSTHTMGPSEERAGPVLGLPVRIGNGVWIGARAVILPGVVVGDGCTIAAGAVVTKNCEPNGLYAGVPAKRVKELTATRLNA